MPRSLDNPAKTEIQESWFRLELRLGHLRTNEIVIDLLAAGYIRADAPGWREREAKRVAAARSTWKRSGRLAAVQTPKKEG